ncbi:unnamed protein product [Periconia digitata]|uniref:Uncharacterized protein n=1 Tax=Periconia digitata TaxID=1303443 RepID=A0A9W4XLE4_9PLEO|nr:unnamed protein product [Periconia digitata]
MIDREPVSSHQHAAPKRCSPPWQKICHSSRLYYLRGPFRRSTVHHTLASTPRLSPNGKFRPISATILTSPSSNVLLARITHGPDNLAANHIPKDSIFG